MATLADLLGMPADPAPDQDLSAAFRREAIPTGPAMPWPVSETPPHENVTSAPAVPATPPAQPRPATPPAQPRPATPPAQPRPATPLAQPRPATPPAQPRPATPPAQLAQSRPANAGLAEQALSFLWGGADAPPADVPYTGPGLAESLYAQMAPKLNLPKADTPEARNTIIGNIVRGNLAGITRIAGGLVGLLDTLDTWSIRNVGALQVRDPKTGGLALGYTDPAEFDQYLAQTKEVPGFGRQVANWLYDLKFGYQTDRVTEDPLGELGKGHIGTVLQWGVETGSASIVDMVAAVAQPELYWGSLIDGVVQERVAANEAVGPGAVDLALGATAAAVEATLERFGAKGILSAAVATTIKKQALRQTLLALAREGGKAAVREGVTETGQQLAEDVAGTAGTKKGLGAAQVAENAAVSGLAGFIFGGAAGGGHATLAGHANTNIPGRQGRVDIAGGRRPEENDRAAFEAFKARVKSSESGGDPNAQNPRSSAGGLYQFTDGTWLEAMRALGFDDGSKSREDLLALKQSGAAQERAMNWLTSRNAATLREAGLPVTADTLHLAHFLGSGDAIRVLTASPDTPVADVVQASAIEANPEVLGGGRTVRDVQAWIAGRQGQKVPSEEPAAPGEVPPGEVPPGDLGAALNQADNQTAADKLLENALSEEQRQQLRDEQARQEELENAAFIRTVEGARETPLPLVSQARLPTEEALVARQSLQELVSPALQRVVGALQTRQSDEIARLQGERQMLIDEAFRARQALDQAIARRKGSEGKAQVSSLSKLFKDAQERLQDNQRALDQIHTRNANHAQRVDLVRQAFDRILRGELRPITTGRLSRYLRGIRPNIADAVGSPEAVGAWMAALRQPSPKVLKIATDNLLARLDERQAQEDRSQPITGPSIEQNRPDQIEQVRANEQVVQEATPVGSLGEKMIEAGIPAPGRARPRLIPTPGTFEPQISVEQQRSFENVSRKIAGRQAPSGSVARTLPASEARQLAEGPARAEAEYLAQNPEATPAQLAKARAPAEAAIATRTKQLGPVGKAILGAAVKRVRQARRAGEAAREAARAQVPGNVRQALEREQHIRQAQERHLLREPGASPARLQAIRLLAPAAPRAPLPPGIAPRWSPTVEEQKRTGQREITTLADIADETPVFDQAEASAEPAAKKALAKPLIIRKAAVAARRTLRVFEQKPENRAAVEDLLRQAAAVANPQTRGQGRLPGATLVRTELTDPETGRKILVSEWIRGLKRRRGSQELVRDPNQRFEAGVVYKTPEGKVSQDPIAAKTIRDAGAVAVLNDMLAKQGLLTSDPELTEASTNLALRKALRMARKPATAANLQRAAHYHDQALVDILVRRAREEGVEAPPKRQVPHENVAPREATIEPKREEPPRAPAEKPVVRIAQPETPIAETPTITREVQVVPYQNQLPAVRGLATQFLNSEAAEGRGVATEFLADQTMVAVNRIVEAHEANHSGFALTEGTGFGKTLEQLLSALVIARKTRRPALILAKNRELVRNFYKAAGQLGLSATSDGSIDGGSVQIRTYSKTANDLLKTIDPSKLSAVLADEVQGFQNVKRQRWDYVQKIFRPAPFVVYATATPGDKLEYGVALMSALDQQKRPVDQFAREELGILMAIDRTSNSVSTAFEYSPQNTAERIIAYVRRMHEEGRALSRRFRREALAVDVDIAATAEELAAYDRITRAVAVKYSGPQANQQRVNAWKRYTQSIKAHHIAGLVAAEVKSGRKVVIMSSINVNALEVPGIGGAVPPMHETIASDLRAAGVNFVTYIGEKRKGEALDAFQRADGPDVILTNPAAAAEGVDLDDQLGPEAGGKPRSLIVADLDWSGAMYQQMLGRVERRNSKSVARILNVLMHNSPSDRHTYNGLKSKLRLLNTFTGYETDPKRVVEGLTEKVTTFEAPRDLLPEYANARPRDDYTIDVSVASSLEAGDFKAALDTIASTAADPFQAEAAADLSRALPNVSVRNMTSDEEIRYPMRDGVYRRTVGAQGVQHEIALRRDPADLNRTILHEAAHAAGSVAIDADPVLRGQMQGILQRVRAEAGSQIPHAVGNIHELWAEAMTDPETRAVLDSIPASRRKTLWGKVVEFVVAALRRLGVFRKVPDSTLDSILELRILDRDQALDERRILTELNRQYGPEMTTTLLAPVIRHMSAASNRDEVQDALRTTGAFQGARRQVLRTLSHEMLIEQGRSLFEDTSGQKRGNLLFNIQRALERRNATARRLQEQGTAIRPVWIEWSNKDPAASDRLEHAWALATYYDLDPSDPNQAAPNRANDPSRAAAWDELQQLWADLGNAKHTIRGGRMSGQYLFRKVADYYESVRRLGERTYIANFLNLVLADPGAGIVVPSKFARDWTSMIDRPGVDQDFKDALAWLESSGALQASGAAADTLRIMASMLTPKKRKFYVPLRRHGDYVISYNFDHQFDSEAEAAQFLLDNPGSWIDKDDPRSVKVHGFATFESLGDAMDAADAMRIDFPGQEFQVERKRDIEDRPAQATHRLLKVVNQRISASMAGAPAADIEAAQRQMRDALITLLPDTAVQKALLKRRGIAGASMDSKRVHAERVQANSFYLAQLRHSAEVFNARQEARAHANSEPMGQADRLAAQSFIEELDKRFTRDETFGTMPGWISTALDIGYVSFLVGPSFSLVNATQPFLLTLPYLASRRFGQKVFGGRIASAALYKAYASVGGPIMQQTLKSWGSLKPLGRIAKDAAFDPANFNVFRQVHAHVAATNPNEAAVLQELADRGKIDQSAALDLRGSAHKASVTPHSNVVQRVGSRARYFVEWSRMLPHMVEVLNRSVTGLAAYRMAVEGGMSHEAAIDEAAHAVSYTQGNYEEWNKAPWIKHKATRPFLMFMQFPQIVYYYWLKNIKQAFAGSSKTERREAFSALVWIATSHAIAGGAIGAMFEPIKWLVGASAYLFGDDDEPWDTEAEIRMALSRNLGPELGELAANGLPSLIGMNLQGRLGISDMLMFNPPDTTERGGFETAVYQRVFGPLGQMARNAWLAPAKLHDAHTAGDYLKVAESLLPKFVKDGFKTYRYATEGLTDNRGHTILDARQIGPWDLFQQSVGLSPATVSNAWEARSTGYEYRNAVLDGRASLLNRYNKASPAEKARIRAREIPEWNRAHPYDFARITGDTLSRSRKAYQEAGRSFYKGVPTRPSERAYMENLLRFSTTE